MNSFELVSKNFRYFIIVKKAPGGITPTYPQGHLLEGQEIIVKIGDEDLETERITKFTANERIQKVIICNGEANCVEGRHILKAQLILARQK